MTGYLALFFMMLAGEVGLFSTSRSASASAAGDGSGDAEEDRASETPPETDSLYDPEAFDRVISGTEDSDTLSGAAETGSVAWFLLGGDDDLDASEGAEFISGGDGDDTILARPGDDTVLGGDGADVVDAGTGNDLVLGEAGDDRLTGNMGNDTLYGGDGADTLLGGSDADLLFGGAGDDYLSGMGFDLATSARAGFDGADTLIGGDGDDTLHMGPRDVGTGGAGADLFRLDQTRPEIGGASVITDFDSALDLIEVWHLPAVGAPPSVVVSQTAPATYAIAIDGQVIAVVTSATPVTPEMIRLVETAAA